jgi:hypothetical protein
VDGIEVCGQCLHLRQGKRLRKPTVKVLEMLAAESEKQGPLEMDNGRIPNGQGQDLLSEWRNSSPPRKSGVKRKRVNINCVDEYAWQDDTDELGAKGSVPTKRPRTVRVRDK